VCKERKLLSLEIDVINLFLPSLYLHLSSLVDLPTRTSSDRVKEEVCGKGRPWEETWRQEGGRKKSKVDRTPCDDFSIRQETKKLSGAKRKR
jgi:hypothetical protein